MGSGGEIASSAPLDDGSLQVMYVARSPLQIPQKIRLPAFTGLRYSGYQQGVFLFLWQSSDPHQQLLPARASAEHC